MEDVMSEDVKLIELAAKASGLKVRDSGTLQDLGTLQRAYTVFGFEQWCHWNPLNNDGDALRLAIDLFIGVSFAANESYSGEPNIVRARHWDSGVIEEYFEDNADPRSAVRRAIVRAAALMANKERS
jgi:hypothetical protein